MDFRKVIQERRSVRFFTKKPVILDKIFEAIDSARLAPMAGNIYTPRFIVIKDDKIKEKISEAALDQEFIKKAPFLVVVCSDNSILKMKYSERAEKYARQQAGAAIENLLLSLVNQGLSSCWVGAFEEEMVKRILKIPDSIEVEAILPIGYEQKKVWVNISKPKKPELKRLVFFEQYGKRML